MLCFDTTVIEIWNGIIFNFYVTTTLMKHMYIALVALERCFLELRFCKDYVKYVDVVCNINRQTYEISRGVSV